MCYDNAVDVHEIGLIFSSHFFEKNKMKHKEFSFESWIGHYNVEII